MASTNKTTHYELPQWIGTDKPTFLGDMNQAYEDIDTAIYNAATAASNAASAAGSAQSAAATAQSAAESAASTASAANTLATTANTNAVAALNSIGSTPLQTTAQTLTAAVNEVLHDVPDDATDIPYDNQTSGLTATTVQGAIDEIAQGSGGVGKWTLVDSVSHTGTSGTTPKTVTLPSDATEFLLILQWNTTIYASVEIPAALATTTTRAGFIDGSTTKIAAALSSGGTSLIAIIDALSTSGTVTAYLYYR